jgi:hypothetical protein
MRSVIYLICINLLFISCTLTPELQFIDVDDTLLIRPDMSRNDVLEIIGKPTAVKSGIQMDDGNLYELWLYQVKVGVNIVDSKLLPRKPPKNMDFEDWLKPSDFYILFKNNLPVRWGDLSFDWRKREIKR